MSWVQGQKMEHELMEMQTYYSERKQCFDDLTELREKLKQLMDANEIAPSDEQLDIEEFDLDTEGTNEAKEFAALECSKEEGRIRQECASLIAYSEAIKAMSWNQMDVKGRNIRGIFTKLKVENYSLLYPDKTMEQELQKVKMWRTAEQMVSANDTFQPWVPLPIDELTALLAQHPHCRSPRSPSVGGGDSNEGSAQGLDVCRNQYTLTGTSSHVFISPLAIRYSQLEVVTYYQMYVENILGYVSIVFGLNYTFW